MSSSLDQRSAKSHEGHAVPSAQTKDVDYAGYMQHPVPGSQMGQPAVADPYYYASYMPFQADASASGWPTGRDAAAAMSYGYSPYAPMTTDYVTGRSMFGQYDYSSWFPGFEYGATSWGASLMPVQPATAPQKGSIRGDYVDPTGGAGYYEVDSSNGVTGINGSSAGAGGSINAVEQGVKSLKVSADEDGVVDHGGNSGGNTGSYARSAQSGAAPAKKSWANIASQPARPAGRSKIVPRAPVSLAKGDVGAGSAGGGSWESKTGPGQARSQGASGSYSSAASSANAGSGSSNSRTSTGGTDTAAVPAGGSWTNAESSSSVPTIAHQYNPKEFDLNPKAARFFVIKSFSEDDIHRSIKYGIWCSTEYGNKRLDTAFREREGKGPIYLFFSVNGSGHFCGVAQMSSPVDYHKSAGVWAQDKWKGQFEVRWIYVKDVPNSQLRHIKLENNEGKPVTNSRDTQEVPPEKGKQVLRVIHQYRHTTSIFDDFQHYEKQQAENVTKKDHGNRSD